MLTRMPAILQRDPSIAAVVECGNTTQRLLVAGYRQADAVARTLMRHTSCDDCERRLRLRLPLCLWGANITALLLARRPQRRAKRLFDALPEETETPDDEDEDGAAAEDDDDLFVDLDLKAPAEEGAHLGSICEDTRATLRHMSNSFSPVMGVMYDRACKKCSSRRSVDAT